VLTINAYLPRLRSCYYKGSGSKLFRSNNMPTYDSSQPWMINAKRDTLGSVFSRSQSVTLRVICREDALRRTDCARAPNGNSASFLVLARVGPMLKYSQHGGAWDHWRRVGEGIRLLVDVSARVCGRRSTVSVSGMFGNGAW